MNCKLVVYITENNLSKNCVIYVVKNGLINYFIIT